MDSLEKIAFPEKTRNAPILKRAKTPEDNDDDQNKKVRTAKSYNVKPNSSTAMSETNVRRDKSSEDDDNYEAPKMGTKEFFIALERFKATSERSEEKMVEEDETHFSTIESFDSPALRPTEGSSEDVQWEIIQVPYSTTNSLPNVTNFQNVPDAIADELDVNQLVADSINNEARSDSRNQQDNGCFTIDNFRQNDNLNETKLDKMDLEEMDNDMNASEILMEEIESQRSQAGPSTTVVNDVRGLAFEGSNTNHLQYGTASSSEAQNNNNHFSTHYEELIKRIAIKNSSRVYSNLKRCGHTDRNSDLVTIKINKNKLNKATRKYSVISSNNYVKSSRNEQKELRTFVTNTMKETYPDLHFKDDVAMRLQIFLWDMLHRIGAEAETLVILSSKKDFDKRVLKYAIKLSLERMKNEADVASGKRSQWLF